MVRQHVQNRTHHSYKKCSYWEKKLGKPLSFLPWLVSSPILDWNLDSFVLSTPCLTEAHPPPTHPPPPPPHSLRSSLVRRGSNEIPPSDETVPGGCCWAPPVIASLHKGVVNAPTLEEGEIESGSHVGSDQVLENAAKEQP